MSHKLVDYVISVTPDKEERDCFFKYSILKEKSDIFSLSKTRYYPCEVSTCLETIKKQSGKYAIVGLPCTLKGIRLLQMNDIIYKERILYLLGLFCGGIKSTHYLEFLVNETGYNINEIEDPDFRSKNSNSHASDYSFSFRINNINNKSHSLRMSSVGDMWGSGFFKANACDYCDDLTGEVADVSFGDAWIHPYIKDGNGTSIVMSRTQLIENIINDGINNNKT